MGRLEVAWTTGEQHQRSMHVATFNGSAGAPLPMIRDVHIVKLTGADLIITGFEEI